ncbi:unnamed protein product [Sphenostylis stenocarpa]|uniref:Uncharacterized protein n=1 Tax=Sphenostylis stenocarpa TaxID=92480 RepID=A0AA86VHZ7_9FABA|nr:unnamed protein product [Sphenostylis stenocarpa]
MEKSVSTANDRITYDLIFLNLEHSVLYGLSGIKLEKRVRLDWPPPFARNDLFINVMEPGSVIRRLEFVAPDDEFETDNMVQLDVDMPFCHAHRASVELYLDGNVSLVDIGDDTFDAKSVQRQLVVLNEYITLITSYAKTATMHISVLGEIGVKESWTNLFVVGPFPCSERPIGIGKKFVFFQKKDKKLAYFDLSNQTMEELNIEGGVLGSQIVLYKECPFQF